MLCAAGLAEKTHRKERETQGEREAQTEGTVLPQVRAKNGSQWVAAFRLVPKHPNKATGPYTLIHCC